MNRAYLEHVNITVTDPQATAELYCRLFDWEIRWSGPAIHGGQAVHVGEKNSYLAVYSLENQSEAGDTYRTIGGLNHLGVVVPDLDRTEDRIKAAGFETYNHADYEPGRRFYFRDGDGIEIEVASYA